LQRLCHEAADEREPPQSPVKSGFF